MKLWIDEISWVNISSKLFPNFFWTSDKLLKTQVPGGYLTCFVIRNSFIFIEVQSMRECYSLSGLINTLLYTVRSITWSVVGLIQGDTYFLSHSWLQSHTIIIFTQPHSAASDEVASQGVWQHQRACPLEYPWREAAGSYLRYVNQSW